MLYFSWQYHIERPLLHGKHLQASVWHLGSLRRKVFLGEVLIPLDGWTCSDRALESFNWYPLGPKVNDNTSSSCSVPLRDRQQT